MAIRRRAILTAICCLSTIATGCGLSGPPIPKTTPVKGQVLVQGKGVAGVRVVFNPQFDLGAVKFAPGATTDQEGRFQLTSAHLDDGAPVGDYVVTFTWPELSNDPDSRLQGDRWNNRYNDPKNSKYKVVVADGDNELEPFRLD
jgi:hypothetical protein